MFKEIVKEMILEKEFIDVLVDKLAVVIITEELVKSRYNLYQLASEQIGAMHVWTMNGKILTKHNERKARIRNEEDVLKIKK
nr:unnamed protein product [Callosobruchus analis]